MWLGWFCWYFKCHLKLWNEMPYIFIASTMDETETLGKGDGIPSQVRDSLGYEAEGDLLV